MASFSVPCPKSSPVASSGLRKLNPQQQQNVSFFPSSKPGPSLVTGSSLDQPPFMKFQGHYSSQSIVCKAQVNEVAVEKSLNSASMPPKMLEVPPSDSKVVEPTSEPSLSDASISAFMTEVASLVKLVDSRDIVELQLKQHDCELLIRKKEALPHPAATPPQIMMQNPSLAFQPMLPSQLPPINAVTPPPPAPAPSALAPALPAPTTSSKSSHPPLKCPMAGTFYRCPAPGEPPFVKVGDKVQKGQVICIIEAMKLMNEIEADQSGTIVEILGEDGKPVSIDMPLFIIEP